MERDEIQELKRGRKNIRDIGYIHYFVMVLSSYKYTQLVKL